MRIVPTKTHGALDYLTGAALLALPKALGLEEVPSSARPQACRRLGNRLQSADGLRDGVAKLPADVRPPGTRRREQRVASFLALSLRVREERHTLLASARARGGAGDSRRRDHQDALINKAIPVTAPEADEDGERQPKGGRNR